MGLARLQFPKLLERARLSIPAPLLEASHDADVWADLLHSAVDMVFRNNLAIRLPEDPADVRHWISPRSALAVVLEPNMKKEDASGVKNPKIFPHAYGDTGLVKLVYRLIVGDRDNRNDVERAGDVLKAIWEALRQTGTIVQVAASSWRLEMKNVAIAPIEIAFECPVTRRLLPFAPAGISMNAVTNVASVRIVPLPRLPISAHQGTSNAQRQELRDWFENDERVTVLRSQGHWTNLHDRTSEFLPYFRAQEHSAQIDRPSLQIYESEFKNGQIKY